MGIDAWILGGGLLAIGLTVFVESGLLIGFFLPGDTLLFGAGILAAQGVFDLWLLIAVIVFAAITGDNVGYSIGRRAGPRLFKKKDSVLFRQSHLKLAEQFYEHHGGKTIIIARFVPIVRTFAPMVAGISKMPRQRFLVFNVVGAVIWGSGVPIAGYYLGLQMPWLEHYIEPVIFGVILLSVGAALFHLLREKPIRDALISRTKRGISNLLLNKKVD